MIHASPDRVGFSPNTSFGLNILASGLGWQSGDNVVISEKEFPANVYPWLRLKDRGVQIRFARTSNNFIDENALIAASDRRTRVIGTSWVQYNNGNRVDLARLGQFCAESGALLSVDGIQGMGAVPIDIPLLKIDLFACGCQKWMLGPCGTGFYYLSERAEALIDPPLSGWLSVDWHAEFSDLMRYDLMPRQGPARFEIGTYPFQDLRALNESVNILLSFKPAEIWGHISMLTEKLISFLAHDHRWELKSPVAQSRRSGIVTFTTPEARRLFDYLASLGFVLSFREGGIRISPHFYNSEDEIDRLIEAMTAFK
jgi:selenocysteine lyase/cysteine desulfurase